MRFTQILLLFLATGCGVKSKPLPPINPPTIGRGEPVFSEATQDIQIKKKTNIKIPGDWEDPKDFEEESPR